MIVIAWAIWLDTMRQVASNNTNSVTMEKFNNQSHTNKSSKTKSEGYVQFWKRFGLFLNSFGSPFRNDINRLVNGFTFTDHLTSTLVLLSE